MWPRCLSSCSPSPHVFFTPGETKQAGHSLPLMNICHSEHTEPLLAHGSMDGLELLSMVTAPASPFHLLDQKLQGQAQRSV